MQVSVLEASHYLAARDGEFYEEPNFNGGLNSGANIYACIRPVTQ